MTTLIVERPIRLYPDEVRAVLAGWKTQTRRTIKLTDGNTGCSAGLACLDGHHAAHLRDGVGLVWRPYGGAPEQPMPADKVEEFCPWGKVGSKLWVKEPFYCDDYRYPDAPHAELLELMEYRASHDCSNWEAGCPCSDGAWLPAKAMPRWASRLTLEITDINVERLQSISSEDAIDEGVQGYAERCGLTGWWTTAFARQWDDRRAKRGPLFAANPWVWTISFCLLESPNGH